ncbi:ABC transporter ATP-binding protein [Pseudothermotoga thermarum]|uniref:Carbohydrate ABC transporter ATP-binding protein, CUT1 family n=1 Tax=Pseudothermotoga thermarum DSM 5069 TaxID=688269 RepID=F7YY63_9THEM|nr:ABC transporter ATP-binding protein [Pseudothermotoga thermarum]AEH50878.1 carbohydrate ABC transporter ATP-binding protein, CUT1 family [Pseudothermotoga thermarum DSM 5069]
MARVEVKNVTKTFGKVVALSNVSFSIGNGEFVVLLGPSGSGKTTLMYLIAGIYKPTSGQIFFDDVDVTNIPPKDRNVGLVFQNWALYPHMKVYENIAFPLTLKKVKPQQIREKVLQVSQMLQIDQLLDRYPWQLSGGQQQRVAIARALVKEPRILLFDEPLSNLDALLRLNVRAEIKKLQKDLKITSIYVTHDQAEALAIADRIVVLNNGRVVQIGTPEEVYAKPNHTFVASFLGNPPANLLEAKLNIDDRMIYIGDSKLNYAFVESLTQTGQREFVLAFRPEHAVISSEYKENSIRSTVYTVEPMGREQIVTLQTNGQIFKVVTSLEQKLQPGQTVYVFVSSDKVLIYDKSSGQRLL